MKLSSAICRAAGAALAVSFLLPLAVSAQTDTPPTPTLFGTVKRNFCTLINSQEKKDKMAGRIMAGEDRVRSGRATRDQKLAEKRQVRDARLIEVRSVVDGKRAEVVNKLLGKTTTDAQSQAVLAFQTAVQAAVTAKRSAIDQARKEFQAGVDNAIAARKVAIDTAIKTFSDEVAAAESKSKTDCAARGADAAKIRETFRASIEASRTKMKEAVQAAEKIGVTAASLNETRKAAFEKAESDFRAAMDKARSDLKASLTTAKAQP
jgi:hypothetical protein